MKKIILLFILIGFLTGIRAQEMQMVADTSLFANVVIVKDKRIDILGNKMYEYNQALSKNIRSGKGYRLMLLSTNDRNEAMQLRARLLQQYPEHKIYMIYQNPFIKLKMGNFVEKDDAERLRKELQSYKVVTSNIYIVPETVEIKPEDLNEKD